MIYKVTLNGRIYEVEVEKGTAVVQAEYNAALPVAAPNAPAASVPAAPAPVVSLPQAASANILNSPLPGVINAIKVTSGQAVTKGTVLILLEAMKMENEIFADKDGKIGQIFVQKGATVNTGAPLLEIL